MALYLAADVMLVTPLRDGMNLVAKEYVASRVNERGALVLSEFTGAAEQMTHAWMVNPYDVVGMKRTIMAALAEPVPTAKARMRRLRRGVLTEDVTAWASAFLDALAAQGVVGAGEAAGGAGGQGAGGEQAGGPGAGGAGADPGGAPAEAGGAGSTTPGTGRRVARTTRPNSPR